MAKAGKGDVIFHRGKAADHDDIWDDSVLIEAYEQAVSLTYDAVRAAMQTNGEYSAEELTKHAPVDISRSRDREDSVAGNSSANGNDGGGKKKNRKKRKSQRKKWQIGDRCLSKYSEDGLWYEAEIITIDRTNNQCTVRYSEYENEEDVNLGMLQKVPETSMDDEDSSHSEREEMAEMGLESEEASQWQAVAGQAVHTRKTVPLMPPPVPPHLLSQRDAMPAEDEAMASMLMSWYTSGYHTGYYQAMQDMKKPKK